MLIIAFSHLSLIKELQHFSSKTKFHRVKFIALTTSSNLFSATFIVEIYRHSTVANHPDRFHIAGNERCVREWEIPSRAEYASIRSRSNRSRDKIYSVPRWNSIKTPRAVVFIERPRWKIEAHEARLRRKVGVSFPKHFPFIRRVFAVLPAPSSGLSGKKPTPVSARTRFNSDAL